MWKPLFVCAVVACAWLRGNCQDLNTTTTTMTSSTAWTTTTPSPGGNPAPFADLRKSLLQDYDPQARPGSLDRPIIVEMSLWVNTAQVEEWNVALHADAFVIMTWQDDRLTWDPQSASGIDSIRLAPSSVWIPDIELQNQIPTFTTALQAMEKLVLVFSNGTVVWVPSVSLKASCALDLIRYPRDRQRCTFIFGSWTYDKTEIDLKLGDTPIGDDWWIATSPWYIAASFAEKQDVVFPNIPGKWPTLRFTFYLHRMITSYCITLYTPIFACMLAAIASLLLWRRVCGTGMIMIALLNTAVLTSVVMYHGLSLRVSGCGVPCIMKFVGSLIALEALMLPLKAICANLMDDVRGESEKTAKPLPRALTLLIAFPAILRKKGKGEPDEACLLNSEVEKKHLDDWARARFVLHMLVVLLYFVGLFTSALIFLTPMMGASE